MNYLKAIAGAYMVTLVLTSSSIFESFRRWIKSNTPELAIGGKHPIECRLCAGFWISIIFALVFDANLFIVYAASYFMATQERK